MLITKPIYNVNNYIYKFHAYTRPWEVPWMIGDGGT